MLLKFLLSGWLIVLDILIDGFIVLRLFKVFFEVVDLFLNDFILFGLLLGIVFFGFCLSGWNINAQIDV